MTSKSIYLAGYAFHRILWLEGLFHYHVVLILAAFRNECRHFGNEACISLSEHGGG